MGLGRILDNMTYPDALFHWLDRQNRKGFQYETKGIDNQKTIKTDFIYFFK